MKIGTSMAKDPEDPGERKLAGHIITEAQPHSATLETIANLKFLVILLLRITFGALFCTTKRCSLDSLGLPRSIHGLSYLDKIPLRYHWHGLETAMFLRQMKWQQTTQNWVQPATATDEKAQLQL